MFIHTPGIQSTTTMSAIEHFNCNCAKIGRKQTEDVLFYFILNLFSLKLYAFAIILQDNYCSNYERILMYHVEKLRFYFFYSLFFSKIIHKSKDQISVALFEKEN